MAIKSKVINLCIFLPTGRTFSFKNVTLLSDNENMIIFSYIAMSDGVEKIATFYKTHIVGISRYS